MTDHSRNSTRRDFLKGKAAARALTGAVDDALDDDARRHAPPDRARSYLLQIDREAMACRFAVYLNAKSPSSTAPEAALSALDLIGTLEDQLTVYRDSSEVSRINRLAATQPVIVESRLFGLFRLALRLYEETGGAYDMTSGALAKLWGFYRRQGNIPGDNELAETMRKTSSKWIELDEDSQTIQFQCEGVELNLGGIGKGYALDRCAELLDSRETGDYLLHGGRSSVLARGGRNRGDSSDNYWTIRVKHPLRPEQVLGVVKLHNRALSTSGSDAQHFYHQGKRYGHILDPRTGKPAEGVISATALAPTAAEADALSTAFYVMGATEAIQYCKSHEGFGVIVIVGGKRAGSAEVISHGVSDVEWTRASV